MNDTESKLTPEMQVKLQISRLERAAYLAEAKLAMLRDAVEAHLVGRRCKRLERAMQETGPSNDYTDWVLKYDPDRVKPISSGSVPPRS